MTLLFPDGYADFSPRLTLAQVKAKHGPKMETEYANRWFACMEAAEGLVGIGGGWRAVQPVKPGFAPPGKSFHESQTWRDGQVAYAALDTIGVNGRHQDAWNWLGANGHLFGLLDFSDVNSEPWHIQANDIPKGWSTWAANGRPNPTPNLIFIPPAPVPPQPPQRIVMVDQLEFIKGEPRWNTRPFGEPLPAGQYGVAFKGSLGKAAVKVNVTITQAKVAGYATIWAGDYPAPESSPISFQAGVDTSTQLDVPLAADGTFKVFISAPAHIVAELVGYWT